jgi:hypothetical protein
VSRILCAARDAVAAGKHGATHSSVPSSMMRPGDDVHDGLGDFAVLLGQGVTFGALPVSGSSSATHRSQCGSFSALSQSEASDPSDFLLDGCFRLTGIAAESVREVLRAIPARRPGGVVFGHIPAH